MSNTKTGGPAFPCEQQTNWTNPGMTMRDYFAAHAPEPPASWCGGCQTLQETIDWRWIYANAMLKARNA
jgi:hypothetical protein